MTEGKIDEKARWQWIAIAVLLVINVLLTIAFVHRQKNRDLYQENHNCVVVSYVGNSATPIYQCDNGLKRREDMQ